MSSVYELRAVDMPIATSRHGAASDVSYSLVMRFKSVVAALALAFGPIASHAHADDPPKRLASVMQRVSPKHVQQTVSTLAGFGTRHTLSVDAPDRGIHAAARWAKSTMEAAGPADGRLRVEIEQFDAPRSSRIPEGAKVINVIGRLQGTESGDRERLIYVVGHLDSRAADVMDAAIEAPGANDDASGCAVVMECCRVLSNEPLNATVVFMLTSGEEQSLVGSSFHAAQAAAKKANIIAVLNNDIVGCPHAPDGSRATVIRLFSEGTPRNPSTAALARLRLDSAESDSPSRQLARTIEELTRPLDIDIRPKLVFRPDRYLRGGDHAPFNDQGFAAVRFTDTHEHYDRQHADVSTKNGKPYGDVPEFVDADYLAAVTRINVAAILSIAMAPASPTNVRISTAKLSNDTTIEWTGSADAAGYEVLWRETTSPIWQQTQDAGSATRITLPQSKDDCFFAVRAYSKDGYRSVPQAASSARE